LPPNVKRPRRRGKGGKRRAGPSATERLMVATARKLGIAPKAKRKEKEVVPRCADHLDFLSVGFLSLADCILYVDSIARRGRKPLNLVRLPKEKCPPGILKVVAVRCRACRTGCYCQRCGGWGWGFRFHVGRRESKCDQHKAA
jgi:hypothetical protein